MRVTATAKKGNKIKILPWRYLVVVVVLATMLAAAIPADANSRISWDSPYGISGDSDVSTLGTLVGAFNLGAPGVADATINDVTFTGLVMTGTSVTSGNFNLATDQVFRPGQTFISSNALGSDSAPFAELSEPYQALLSSAAGGGANAFTLTMSGLVAGATYQFQWWKNISNGGGSYTYAQSMDANDPGITLNGNPSETVEGGGLGQFAIGTFVADSTMVEKIAFLCPDTYEDGLNGFQLRVVSATIPEASTDAMLLLGIGLAGLGSLRRKIVAAIRS